MATFLSSESRRLYSWWWDSHISPKNSKWLQENLTDIDAKVKAMIKIINEDADSFARRAEMYYKKWPELMKLVEDFYRAYRALAERYDHATGELRLAQKTMAEAFPNHAPSVLSDDASSCSESCSPMNPHLVRAFFDPDYSCKELDVDSSRKGLKQLNEMFQTGEAMLRELKLAEEKLMDNLPNGEDKDSKLDQNSYLLLDKKMSCKTVIHNEPGRVAKAEAEMQSLKEALAKMEAERDAVLVDYRQNLEKLSSLEDEFNSVQNDAKELGNHASEAQSEVKALKESLAKLEAERDSSHDLYKRSSERLAILEANITAAQEDAARWSGRAIKAETESQNLRQEISTCESERQDALVRYEESMNKISSLEEKLLLAEENVKQLRAQIDLAESEIRSLKENLSSLGKAKEDAYLRHHQCLDTISRLQNELMEAKEDIKRLNSEILLGSAKLKGAEDQCAQLDKRNQSLKLEADGLAQRITEKDQQLIEKQNELEKLMNYLQGEQSRFVQVEATLDSLQNLHSQSQEEQRALVFELTSGLQMLKNLELRKQDLELEIQHLKEENRGLNDLKLASSITEREMEHEILGLREIKENFEVEVKRQAEQNDILQLLVQRLKAEIEELFTKYQDLLQQVQSTGIDPKCVRSSIKDLVDENSRLKEISAEEKAEKEALLRKLEDMDELFKRSAVLESSLSNVNVELECSKETMKVLQESRDVLSAEKSSLVAEKSALLSQLQIITENMRHLLEKDSSLENSLQGANAELQDLRVKSKSLEDVCQFLKDEKSSLHSERSRLISQLENVEKKVGGLETKFTTFEDRHAAFEKEKESAQNQITELRVALSAEKHDSKCLALASEARLTDLKDHISYLQEENKYRRKDFEEQLEKAVNAQVEIFILQKFMQDMEERNSTLTAECQRHADAEKYSEIVISELESENMMQHLETELLLDRIDKIRRGIFQVLKALEIDDSSETEPEIFLPHIAADIKGMKRDLLEGSDDNQQLAIQNTVLSAAVGQMGSEGSELVKEKEVLKNGLFFLNQQHAMLEHEKGELLERSERLDVLVAEEKMKQKKLEAEMEVLNLKQESLQTEYAVLQEEHSNVLKTKRCLQDRLSKAEEEKHLIFEENTEVIYEAVSFSNECVVLRSSCVQKALELEKNAKEMDRLLEACTDFKNEARLMKENLAIKEAENFQLSESNQKLEVKNMELTVFNDQLKHQFLIASEQINQKKGELVEAEQKIETLQDVNTKLLTSIGTLEMRCDGLAVICDNLEMQILELSRLKECQEKEIASLREANKSLEAEVDILNEDIEACNIREMILNSELQEQSCEFGLWEAEAESFYFDLQTCGVREALYENTVHELGGLCNDLEDVSIIRSFEIEQMKDKMCFLERENEGFKSQLAAYVPAIASLRKNVLSLEQNPALQTKLHLIGTSEHQVTAICDLQERDSAEADDESSELDGLQELQDLQIRIEAIENVLATEKSSMQEYLNANIKLEAALKEIEELKSRVSMQPIKTDDLKDIPLDHASDVSSSSNRRGSDRLDQMLELWETAEQDSTRHSIFTEEPAQVTDPGEIEKELGVDKQELCKDVSESKIIIEKLQSDAQMLESMHTLVQDLKRKFGSNKKGNSAKAFEYERLRGQLQDVEVSVVRLVDANTQLTKKMEGSSSWGAVVDSTAVAGVSEQASKEAERIEKLQLDVQKIQHILLNLEDENISNIKGKSRFLKSQTGIFMRDLIYSRGRKNETRRKLRFCGCFKPSQNGV